MNDKIIKSDSLPGRIIPSSAKVLKREVFEATQDARDVVAVAEERARRIVAEAQQQRDQILEEARQQGQARGLAEWNTILARARQRADELAQSWEETMLRLSIKVAEKIIGEELHVRPEAVVSIVREALKGTRTGKRMTIQVNDADLLTVRSRMKELRESLGSASDIEVISSAAVSRGGCVVESELGIIDARLETQLKCLEDALIRGASGE